MNFSAIMFLSYLFVITFNFVSAEVAFRQKLVSYNLWNYSGSRPDDNSREDNLKLVLMEINPDLLMVQELENYTGYKHFLEDVLNEQEAGRYEGAPFSDQPDTDNDIALYYRTGHYEVVSSGMVNITSNWGHRDATEFLVRHILSGQELGLYGVHFKAGNDISDASDRLSEALSLRMYLNGFPTGSHFLVMGDYNVYDSEEGGFQRLVESQEDNDGRLFDPINQIGYWHNNASYAAIHTQSTRSSYGGMDDRFDFILTSSAILDSTSVNYVDGSYMAFGNDGTRCCDDSINSGTNGVVSQDIADALYQASDHLPVVMELEFTDPDALAEENKPALIPVVAQLGQNYPNPFNLYTTIPFSINVESYVSLKVIDLSGRMIENVMEERKTPGQYIINWNPGTRGSGIYFFTLQINEKGFTKKLLLLK